MNDAIAMMFSILIVMFGYLVFKIRTDQSQTTTTSTRKRRKKRGTGKPVIKNNWNMRPLDTNFIVKRSIKKNERNREIIVRQTHMQHSRIHASGNYFVRQISLYNFGNPCYIELSQRETNV